MVREMLAKKATHREQTNSDHRLKFLLDRYTNVTKELADLYEDKDGSRKAEIDVMSRTSDLVDFYSRLKNIKDYYKKNPNEMAIPLSSEYEEFLKSREGLTEFNLIDFTDEEGYGKFLDMNECFNLFINLKGVPRVDYLTYLSTFDRLHEIPREHKFSLDYRRYLDTLHNYLYDFCLRVKPLLSLDEMLEKHVLEQKRQFEIGSFPGWTKESAPALSHSGAPLDLTAFSSVDELASLGLDRLKSALMALGLKCGGSLKERADRLWLTKGKDIKDLPSNLFVNKDKDKKNSSLNTEKSREIAMLEAKIYRLIDILSSERQATIENVQRKQARTAGERDESDEEVVEEDEDDDEDKDGEVIYNPKNLPLGWDGKPIPYWLYKLHGLNITYTCEICGNATYKGPKAFQKHFAEWRHAHGMRCLGIPNTAHFANVTSIEDALKLWQKLKDDKTKEKFQPLNEEEFEDSEGRVVNKKTYEDLKRQGLL